MRDFAIQLTHRPGELGRVAHALADVEVAGMAVKNQVLVRLIPDDVDAARNALREGSIPFEEHELATVLLENKAGELEDVASKLSNANINLEAVYVVGLDGDLVELALAVDDVKKAKKLLE